MSDLLDLAAKVEALTGPCRETDVAIWRTLAYATPATHPSDFDLAPNYTASLDAAMTLVPANIPWLALAGLDRPTAPALALTAAALRALAATEKRHD